MAAVVLASAAPAAAMVKPPSPTPPAKKSVEGSCTWKGDRTGKFITTLVFSVDSKARRVTLTDWSVVDQGSGRVPFGVTYTANLSYAPNPPLFKGRLDKTSTASGKVTTRVNQGENITIRAASTLGSCTVTVKIPSYNS